MPGPQGGVPYRPEHLALLPHCDGRGDEEQAGKTTPGGPEAGVRTHSRPHCRGLPARDSSQRQDKGPGPAGKATLGRKAASRSGTGFTQRATCTVCGRAAGPWRSELTANPVPVTGGKEHSPTYSPQEQMCHFQKNWGENARDLTDVQAQPAPRIKAYKVVLCYMQPTWRRMESPGMVGRSSQRKHEPPPCETTATLT